MTDPNLIWAHAIRLYEGTKKKYPMVYGSDEPPLAFAASQERSHFIRLATHEIEFVELCGPCG